MEINKMIFLENFADACKKSGFLSFRWLPDVHYEEKEGILTFSNFVFRIS